MTDYLQACALGALMFGAVGGFWWALKADEPDSPASTRQAGHVTESRSEPEQVQAAEAAFSHRVRERSLVGRSA
jgi:hypothetical protein